MKEKITITIDADLVDYLNKLADADSRSVSSTINKIVRDYQTRNKGGFSSTSIL